MPFKLEKLHFLAFLSFCAVMAADSTQLTVTEAFRPNIEESTTTAETAKELIQPRLKTEKKVGLVYYLSRNGQLEHPHFMELTVSSPQGLYLRDVIDALNLWRGQGMAAMYSWASKRSYKKGYLWQDLSDDDLIHPNHGGNYILKGSLLLENCQSFRSSTDSASSSKSIHSSETNNSRSEDANSPRARGTNYSWSSSDEINDENNAYKAKTSSSEQSRTTGSNEIRRVESEIEEASIVKPSRNEMNEATLKFKKVYNSGYNNNNNNNNNNNVRHQKVVKTKDLNLLMKLIGCGCGSKRFNDFQKMSA